MFITISGGIMSLVNSLKGTSLNRKLFRKIFEAAFFLILIEFSVYSDVSLNDSQESANKKTLTYKLDKFDIMTSNVNGKKYSKINLENTIATTLEKGFPELPVLSASIMTNNCNNVEVKIKSVKYKTVSCLPVIPSKGSLKRNVDPTKIAMEESGIYRQDKYYPEKIVSCSSPYYIRNAQGVSIRIMPFSYNGAKNELRIAEEIEFSIEEMGSSRQADISKAITPEYDNLYNTHFLNYENNLRYTPVMASDKMIIITASKYIDAADELASWKNRIGIKTDVYIYPTETGGSGANNVKQFIQSKYDSDGISYITLIGDFEDIPSEMVNAGSEVVSSDPDFAMLSGNDLYADAFVGRISVETKAEADIVVQKIINYEKTPDIGANWYKKAISIGSCEGSPADYQWLRDSINPVLSDYNYSSIDGIYEDWDGNASGTENDMTKYVNNGRGLINFMGHGSPDGFGFSSPWWYGQDLIDNLSNGNKLPIIIPLACNLGQFENRTCAAESWIRNPNGGAIAIVASSPLMDWNPPQTAQVEINRLFAAESHLSFGAYFYNSEMKMLDVWGSNGDNTMRTWNYFGDPSVQFITDSPTQLVLNHPTVPSKNFEVTGPEGTRVCIYSPAEDKMESKTIVRGTVTFDMEGYSADSIFVTGTKRNMAPYLEVILSGSVNISSFKNSNEKPTLNQFTSDNIGFDIKKPGNYELTIHSLNGRLLFKSKEIYSAGNHKVKWNGKSLFSGIYMVSLVNKNMKITNKMIIK